MYILQQYAGAVGAAARITACHAMSKGWTYKKCNFDVDMRNCMRPPADIMTFRRTLTYVSFDLDPCDLWPPTLHVSLSKETGNSILTCWPWPLTFRLTLTLLTIDLDQCDLWPWPMWPLTINITCNEAPNPIFDLVNLTFDLWPLPSESTLGHPRPCSDQISSP